MGRIARDVIDTVRDRLDIAAVVGQVVTLRKKGGSLMGLCPFHQEKSPSFSVVPAKGIYHCFGCGEGGDAFQFVMKTRGIAFADAVRELAATVGIDVEEEELSPEEVRKRRAKATLYDVCEAAKGWFRAMLETSREGAEAREYLDKRGITKETSEAFGFGFAPDRWDGLLNHLHKEGFDPDMAVKSGLARWRDPDNRGRGAYDLFRGRLIVPVEDDRGRLVAFGGRVMPSGEKVAPGKDAPPKYVNSPETDIYRKSHVLYALPKARPAIQRRDRIIVVEGYFDVIALHQAGFTEAVATCGTALTQSHLETVRRLTRKVVAQFDADAAGENAAAKSLPMFLEAGIEPLRLDLGQTAAGQRYKDPDELVKAEGAPAFERALERAEPLFELVLRRTVSRHGITPGGKERTLNELAPIVRVFPEAGRQAAIERVAAILGIPDRVVGGLVGRARTVSAPGASSTTDSATTAGRWNGTIELNHLLWMLVHHRVIVAPLLMSANPELLTERPTVRQAMGLLLMGRGLPEVLEEVGDPELSRVLLRAAGRLDLYTPEQIEPACRQILARYELQEVEAQLQRLVERISACDPAGDAATYFELSRERLALQRKRSSILKTSPAGRA